MIEIEANDYKQTKCNNCIHRHVCMYRDSADEFQPKDLPFLAVIIECKYYSEQTLEPIKIN